MIDRQDEYWMRTALKAAVEAEGRDEVPVGACIIDSFGQMLSVGSNLTITNNDPTAHAEILVLRAAAIKIGNYRLTDTTLYTTIEPCVMCAGALVNARIRRVVYGAEDPRYGGVESVFRLCDSPVLNHRVEIVSGILRDECASLIRDFFLLKRAAGLPERQTES